MPLARAFVEHTLRSADAPVEIIERVVLATAEACNNAILHAAGEDFTLSVVVEDSRALVSVSDDGDGFEPPGRAAMPGPLATGRRGLALMQALVDDVDVTSGPSGTTVALVHDFSVAAVPAGAGGL